MKIKCNSCRKLIDNDSSFCKFCGLKIDERSENDSIDLKLIFSQITDTLQKNSKYSVNEFNSKFDSFKKYENRKIENDQYYQMLVDVIFYSGFKASTVDLYLPQIHKNFPIIDVVRKYSPSQLTAIKNDPQMIRNKWKIDACYQNALKMSDLIKKHGNFTNYINSFGLLDNDNALFALKKSLQSNFLFLGGKTVYHFMMDIGLNVLKPDRVILRIFSRLGLIDNEEDLEGAVKVGRAFSKATGFPIRYIDIIFVMYGQLDQDGLTSICTEKNPKCHLCGAKASCQFSSQFLKGI